MTTSSGDPAVRMWFYTKTTRKLFKYRYAPVTNFSANNQSVFHSLGAFGTGVMMIDQFYDVTPPQEGAPLQEHPLR